MITEGWDGEPSSLWRKRLARHVRDCSWCLADTADMIPAERLLGGLPLLAVPAGLAGRALSRGSASQFGPRFARPLGKADSRAGSRPSGRPGVGAARHARHARMLSKGAAVWMQPKLIAVSLAVATCAAGGTFAVAHAHRTPVPAVLSSVSPPPSPLAARPVPLVNFITVHWYGGDFATGPAVQELESYLQAIYARYHLPIWITEFALTSYSGATAAFPTESQQAAFLTAATKLLDGLSYVQRYAWFALSETSGSGTTGLFNPGPSVTQVGEAFESAR